MTTALVGARRWVALACFSLPALLAGCAGGGDDPGVVIVDPAGSSTPTAPAGGGTSQPSGHRAPSQNFDLSHWKLTLPSGKEVQNDQLNAGYEMADTFFTDRATGGMVFRCPNIAGTTANSKYSRTELREMLAPGGPAYATENNWTVADGGVLRATLRVDRVSTTGEAKKVGRVIIGQIHGDGSEVIRLYYHKRPDEAKGRIYAALDSAANVDSWSPDIVTNDGDNGIALGERFSYEIRLEGFSLTVRIEPEHGPGVTFHKYIDPNYASHKLYFKAGVYNQNNTGDVSDYVQATFFSLNQSH